MRSFLLKEKKPICKWGKIPDGVFFEGKVPEGYGLAISPHWPYVILDIDRHGDIDGYENIPDNIKSELLKHFQYKTKNNGIHVWLKYTGEKYLGNKSSGIGNDLRNFCGYVRWYLPGDIRDHMDEILETTPILNNWLEELFCIKCPNEKKYRQML